MLNKQQFFQYVEKLRDLNAKRDNLEELGIDVGEFFDELYYLSDLAIESNFDTIGRDAFFAWFYEESDTAKDSSGIYLLENIDEMWNFLTKHYNYEPTEEIPNFY